MNYKDGEGIVMKFYRLEHWLYCHKMKPFAQIVYHFIQIAFGCTIPYSAKLEKGVKISHFHGIVIHHESTVGEGTVLFQNVSLGGRNGTPGPNIGKYCVIGAGACVLGNITIGNHVNIGANAVVLEDVPDHCTVVGVPARIVKRGN